MGTGGRGRRSGALTALLLLSLLPRPAHGQILVGRAVDVADNRGVPGAEVQVLGADGTLLRRVLTDGSGIFLVPVDRGGLHLRVSRLGYRTVETGPVEVGASERVVLEVRLTTQPLELEPLHVVARAADPRQRDLREYLLRAESTPSAGLNVIYTRADLASMDSWRVEEFLAREAPRLGHPLPSLTHQGDRCRPLFFWDGVPREPDPLLGLSNLEGVEFYRGVGPAGTRFRNPRGCGVVLFWTRPLASDPRARPASRRRLVAAGIAALLVLTLRIF